MTKSQAARIAVALAAAAGAIAIVLALAPLLAVHSRGAQRGLGSVLPAREDRGWAARLRRFAARAGRAWRAAPSWLWPWLAAWVGGAYAITYWALPGLRLAPSTEFAAVRPALWLSVALLAAPVWLRGLPDRPGALNRVALLGALVGVFHVSVLVLTGVMLGLGHSPYGHSAWAMAQNASYVSSGIIGLEMARACLVTALARRSPLAALALVSVGLALVTIPPARFGAFGSTESAFQTSGSIFLPALSESLLSSFLALSGGPLAPIAYRGALEAFRWFSPVLPDVPWGTTAFVGTLTPAVALLLIRGLMAPEAAAGAQQERGGSWVALPYAVAVIVVSFLWLSSGLLGIRPSLISGVSMKPTLEAGDIVITRDVSPKDIKVGDIVRFRNGSITIMHRVTEIYRSGTTTWVVTKGDNNNHADNPITADQVEGRVVAVIPKVGWVGIFIKNTIGDFLGLVSRAGPGSDTFFAKTLTADLEVRTGDFEKEAPQTPGYWKNHADQTAALLPQSLGDYVVDTWTKARAVFDAMSCGEGQPNGALGCLAGQLLAAKLNVANGADPCIGAVTDKADGLLRSKGYAGPGAYSLTPEERAMALSLKDLLANYNNGGGCPDDDPPPGPSAAPTPSPTSAPAPSPTASPVPTPTPSLTPTPTATPGPSPSATPGGGAEEHGPGGGKTDANEGGKP